MVLTPLCVFVACCPAVLRCCLAKLSLFNANIPQPLAFHGCSLSTPSSLYLSGSSERETSGITAPETALCDTQQDCFQECTRPLSFLLLRSMLLSHTLDFSQALALTEKHGQKHRIHVKATNLSEFTWANPMPHNFPLLIWDSCHLPHF